jgi:uncharacterized phage infection (PIP) family protein YhgE
MKRGSKAGARSGSSRRRRARTRTAGRSDIERDEALLEHLKAQERWSEETTATIAEGVEALTLLGVSHAHLVASITRTRKALQQQEEEAKQIGQSLADANAGLAKLHEGTGQFRELLEFLRGVLQKGKDGSARAAELPSDGAA